VGPSAGLDRCGKSRLPPGFDPRTVQPVARRYSNYATRPTSQMVCACIYPASTIEWLIRPAKEATRQVTVPRSGALFEFGLLKAFLNESIEDNLNSILLN
jgi:hypothetical protein